MRTNAVRPWPDVAIPPGETLAETLETLGMSQAELARRMDRPVQAVNEIIRGSKEITAETAIQLERVLGIPAHVWVRLEADFWFTLYHELGHVLLHRRREVFIETGDAVDDEREHEANIFASDALIPPDYYVRFLAEGHWRSAEAVTRLADAIGIAPSIVVGRLQYERRIPYSQLNHLRSRFRWRAHPQNGG